MSVKSEKKVESNSQHEWEEGKEGERDQKREEETARAQFTGRGKKERGKRRETA